MNALTITVNVADRPYRLTINREEEEIVRDANELVHKQMQAYKEAYAYKDQQDLLAMVVLQFATSAVKLEKNLEFRDQKMESILEAISRKLDDQLNSNRQAVP